MIKAFIFDVDEVLVSESGASGLLLEAEKSGVSTAALSEKNRNEMEERLLEAGLPLSLFDVLLSAEDVRRFKPCPDIYTLALIKLGIEKNEALAFERDEDGIKGALSAGITVCGLTSFTSSEKVKELGASIALGSLSSFPEFDSPETLEREVKKLLYGGMIRYGANWILPLERRPEESVVEKEAVEKAVKAMYNAYAPYSKFRVGAAVVSAATGRIYSGCNMENASYGATICAERNAITTAVASEGVIGIDMVVVSSESIPPAMPCAVCLQVMSEFIRPDTPIILVSTAAETERYSFSDLLPHPFEFGE